MACAVEKTLHASVALPRFESLSLEELQDVAMNFRARDVVAEFFESHILAAADGVVGLAHRLAGASFDHRPRDVAEIAGLLRARKNVENDGFVGAQNAVPALVRVAGLPAAGDDGVGGNAAGLDHGDVDYGAEFLRGQRHIVIKQFAVASDFGRFQNLDAFGQSDLGHHQGGADFFYFIGVLALAFGKEGSVANDDFDFQPAQFTGEAVGKIAGNKNLFQPVFPHDHGDDGTETIGRLAFALELFLRSTERKDTTKRGPAGGAVGFNVAQG